MASTRLCHHCLLALTLMFVSTSVCVSANTVQSDGQITWDPLPAEPTYNTTAEEPSLPWSSLFGMATGFINKVPPKEIPWEVLRGLINGTVDAHNDYTEFVSYSAGFLTCFAVAIIFIILMPIIGIIFCCCRCCDNCGGKMLQRDKYNTKCRRISLLILLLFTTIMATFGLLCGFTSNAEMSNALQRADSTLDSNVKDLLAYLNNTMEQFNFVAFDQYNYVHGLLINDLDNVGRVIGDPVKAAADPMVEPAIDAVIQLAKETVGIQQILQEMVNTTRQLTESARSLQQELDMERAALNFTLGTPQCHSTRAASCLSLKRSMDLNLLQLAANFGIETTLEAQYGKEMSKWVVAINKMSSSVRADNEMRRLDIALRTNLTELVYKGKAEYENITSKIDGDSFEMVRDVKIQLDNVRSAMQTEVLEIQKEVDIQINTFLKLESSDSPNSSAEVFLKSFEEAQSYDQYRFFAGIALCCVILVIVFCNYLGIIFGECGRDKRDRPTERGCLANTGGSFLLTAVTLIFMFSPLIMLATTLSFLAGGATEKALCKPMDTGDIFREVIDYPYLLDPSQKYWLSYALYQVPNIPLTTEEVIKGCQENGAIYEVINLESLFNITAELDYRSQYPELLNRLNTFSISLEGLQLVDDPTKRSFLQIMESGISSLDYTGYLIEVQKGITGVNLTTTAILIEMAAAAIPDRSLQSQLKSHATNLRRIQEDTVDPMTVHVTTLTDQLFVLQNEASDISNKINQTVSFALNAQEFVVNQGGMVLSQEIRHFASRLLGYMDQYVDYVKSAVYRDMGRCKPIANIYNSFDVLVCSYSVDSLNGFWLALGWCIFWFIPSIIFAVKLSKFYRRMRYFEDYFNTHDLETVPMKIYED